MFRRFARKRRAASLALLLLLLFVGGVAVAFFTSNGQGTGQASVGSATHFTVTVSSDNTGALYPGAGSETLTYTVHNPGSAGYQILHSTSSAVAEGTNHYITEDGTEVNGCLASWFSTSNTQPAGLPQNLAPNANSAQGTVAVTMLDSGSDQDKCQGHTPDITVSAS